MKDSTAVSIQWCMPVNFFGGVALFAFLVYSVQGQMSLSANCKTNLQSHRDYAKEKG